MSKILLLKRKHNWVTEGVTGNFEVALINLISDLKDGKKCREILIYEWDKARGNDWFTQTRKDITDIDLDTDDGWKEYLKGVENE
jgi:hypothetical protein